MILNAAKKVQSWLEGLFATATGDLRRPLINRDLESNVKNLFIIGDLAGAPVIKLAMEHGVRVVEAIKKRAAPKGQQDPLDIIIVGAGAAGLNAALAAQEAGYSYLVLEKEKIANTIENFPEGKWVYAEPDHIPPRGKLWLDGATREDLIRRWHQIVQENNLQVHVQEPVEKIERQQGLFVVQTPRARYRARFVVLAIGQRGNPRKLGVPGEDQEGIYHRLYSPRKYQGEQILVVGGGNSAVEAALTLCEHNQVVLSYRGGEFHRLFKDNARKLNAAIAAGKIKVIFHSRVIQFDKNAARLEVEKGAHRETLSIPFNHAFILIGAELPTSFLKSAGVRLENEWEGSLWSALMWTALVLFGLWFWGAHTGLVSPDWLAMSRWLGAGAVVLGLGSLIRMGRAGKRWGWLGFMFLISYTIYGAKSGPGQELWPFTNWGYQWLSLGDRPWSFWYTVLYTVVMTVFGLQALKRWGLDRKDRFQVWRYVSLLGFQWVFFFLIPEFLFQWAVKFQWLGELSRDPVFAQQAWRAYGLVYAWPLFFYTFFYNPHQVWIVWGVLLSFVIIPVFVLFHGKRYCSWICGCGGLAETFGDRWRHYAPKGKRAKQWERMNGFILLAAVVITLSVLGRDLYGMLQGVADRSLHLYRVMVDIWMVGIIPITLYPFLGGKVWCRYWCPLAKMMELFSRFYTRKGLSKFHIFANDKCIACNECTRHCQVGINVMNYALKQETLDNGNSSCIGCGICVTVCPMDVLSFQPPEEIRQKKSNVQFIGYSKLKR